MGFADEGDPSSLPVKAAAFVVLSEARSAGLRVVRWSWPAARSRVSSDRPTGSALATLRSSSRTETALKDMQTGSQETLETDKVVHAALRGLRDLA